jgi:hypothetical protein
MAADKRSVHTDALATLGSLIGDGEKRDAIHLAVEPVECGARILHAGEHVKLVDGKAQKCLPGKGVGIVDPFLETEVIKGEKFWLVVYPRQITSLRHVWDHPAFPAADNREPERVTVPRPPKRRSLSAPLMPRVVGANAPGIDDSTEIKPTEHDIELAKIAIGKIASMLGEGYDDLMDAAKDWTSSGSYWSQPKFEGESIPKDFWNHYEVVTGEKVKQDDKYSFLTCSCS